MIKQFIVATVALACLCGRAHRLYGFRRQFL